MTDETITPALTPDEWANEAASGRSLDFHPDGSVENTCCACPTPPRHALAALALHGQPFGFTHEDVAYLRTVGSTDDAGFAVVRDDRLLSIAARIAAMLAPAP